MRPVFHAATLAGDRWVVDGLEHNDDGTPHTDEHGQQFRRRLVFPADTLEWRAAEYRIDSGDTATLLDLVISEAFLTAEDWATGSRLHDAPDIDTARRDHLARCAAAKWRHRIATRTAGNPCRVIETQSPMDDEAVGLKRTLVHRAREQYAAAQQEAAPDRLAVLRAAVEGGPDA